MATTGKPVQYQLNSSLSALSTPHTSQHNTQYEVETQQCTNCKSTNIIEDTHQGNYVCAACGTVLSTIIDTGTEWRTFQDDGSAKGENANRVGGYENALLADMGLSTVIGRSDNSNHLARTQMNSTVDIKHKYLLLGFEKCQSIANSLNLTKSIIDRSKETFKRSVDVNAFKPKLLDCVVTACIFISCQQEHVPRSLKELCATAHVQQRDVGRCFKKLRELKLHKRVDASGQIVKEQEQDSSLTTLKAIDTMLDRFCSLLILPPTITKVCQYICKRAVALDLVQGRQLASIAAGSICLATQCKPEYRRDYNKVAQVTYMSPTTVKAAYISLYNKRHELIPSDFVNKEILDALKLSANE